MAPAPLQRSSGAPACAGIGRSVRWAGRFGLLPILLLTVAPAVSADVARPFTIPGMTESRAAPAGASSQPASTRRMIKRLQGLDRDVDPLEVPFFAGKTALFFEKKIIEAKTPGDLIALKLPHAMALLNDGRSEEALKEIDDFERLLKENGMTPRPGDPPRILLLRAICFLRLGEQENCVSNHNADSCLLPIQGGGVHKEMRGSLGAIRVLQRLLDTKPTPYAAWLFNIAHMTLGKYPDGVAPQWRIPPEVFASDYDIKRFPDVAGPLGLDVDDLSGSVVMDDFDNDGNLDLMFSGSGLDSQLHYFHNNGDGTFTELTDSAGLTGLTGGLNLIQGDYNNDGKVDVFVLRGGWLAKDGRYPNSLLRNNGDNTFTDVTEETGLLSFHSTQTAVWFDYNNDGWLDLFIGNETVAGTHASDPCELYRNNGDGTFTECAAENGVAITAWVKGVVAGDFNNDGRPDLFLSVFMGPNMLLRNDGPAATDHAGKARWHFTNVAAAAGVTEPSRSFPCWFWDFDNDGWLDIFVCGYGITDAGDVLMDYMGATPPQAELPRLYHNNRDGTFTDVSKQAGVARVLEGMGANFGDLDNDGWLDFYVGTGDPNLGTLVPNRMFRNAEGRGFQDVTTSGGFGQLQKGHGIAFGDLNNDGAQDVYSVVGGALAGDHYPNQLLANPGHGNHWLKLKLEGGSSNRSALGARIKVVIRTDSGERAIYRVVGSGGSFGCSPLRQEIGLAQAKAIVSVEIFWPKTGQSQTVAGLALDHCYQITENVQTPRELVLKPFSWPDPAKVPGGHHHHMGAAGN